MKQLKLPENIKSAPEYKQAVILCSDYKKTKYLPKRIALLTIFLHNLYNSKQTILLPRNKRQYPYNIHGEESLSISWSDRNWLEKVLTDNQVTTTIIGNGKRIKNRYDHLLRNSSYITLNVFRKKTPDKNDIFLKPQPEPQENMAFIKKDDIKENLPDNHPEVKKLQEFNKLHKELNGVVYKRHFGKNTREYGRFYAGFQNIPKVRRKKILEMNDYVEADFSAFNLNLAYMLETGKPFQGEDCYTAIMDDLDIWHVWRQTFKPLIISLFACKSPHQTRQSIHYQLYQKKLCSVFTAKEIIDSIERVHKPISAYFHSQFSKKAQNIESNVIYQVSYHLLKLGKPHYLIHDCIVCKSQDLTYVEYVMNKYLIRYVRSIRNASFNTYYNVGYNSITTKQEKTTRQDTDLCYFNKKICWYSINRMKEIGGKCGYFARPPTI